MARFYSDNGKFEDLSLFSEDMSKPACVPTGDYVKIVKDPSSGISETYKAGIGTTDKQISGDSSFVKRHMAKDK